MIYIYRYIYIYICIQSNPHKTSQRVEEIPKTCGRCKPTRVPLTFNCVVICIVYGGQFQKGLVIQQYKTLRSESPAMDRVSELQHARHVSASRQKMAVSCMSVSTSMAGDGYS